MAKGMEEHEAMDKIMKYINDDYTDKYIHSSRIWKELFHSEDEDIVYRILNKMMNLPDPVFEFHVRNGALHAYDVIYKKNGLTQRSIDQGGFTAFYEKKVAAQKEADRIGALEKKKLENEVTGFETQKRLSILGLVIAVLAFGYTIYSDFQNLSKSDFDAMQNKTASLEQRIKLLEQKLQTMKYTEPTISPTKISAQDNK